MSYASVSRTPKRVWLKADGAWDVPVVVARLSCVAGLSHGRPCGPDARACFGWVDNITSELCRRRISLRHSTPTTYHAWKICNPKDSGFFCIGVFASNEASRIHSMVPSKTRRIIVAPLPWNFLTVHINIYEHGTDILICFYVARLPVLEFSSNFFLSVNNKDLGDMQRILITLLRMIPIPLHQMRLPLMVMEFVLYTASQTRQEQ